MHSVDNHYTHKITQNKNVIKNQQCCFELNHLLRKKLSLTELLNDFTTDLLNVDKNISTVTLPSHKDVHQCDDPSHVLTHSALPLSDRSAPIDPCNPLIQRPFYNPHKDLHHGSFGRSLSA